MCQNIRFLRPKFDFSALRGQKKVKIVVSEMKISQNISFLRPNFDFPVLSVQKSVKI